jgi:hypothetical protein
MLHAGEKWAQSQKGAAVHEVSPHYLWIYDTWYWPSMVKKITIKKRNFKTQNFKFLCAQGSVDGRSSQSRPGYHQLCLSHCAIFWVFSCPSFCEKIFTKAKIVPPKSGKSEGDGSDQVTIWDFSLAEVGRYQGSTVLALFYFFKRAEI